MAQDILTLPIIDTHTGGEPTRVIVNSSLEIRGQDAQAMIADFRTRYDYIRQGLVSEPRASEHWVAAWVFKSNRSDCSYGILFLNNVGYLGMCGHGTMGVAVALHHAGLLPLGKHRFETCVGQVAVDLRTRNQVAIENVPSHRWKKAVPLTLPNGQVIHGDIAWGGNWFFISKDHEQTLLPENIEHLLQYTRVIRTELQTQGVTAADEAEIDHIELIGPPSDPNKADSRNFVLCPGGEYDRSPCGTGTSAKVACMAADGTLAVNTTLRQESILGSLFEASYLPVASEAGATHNSVLPTIVGSAYVSSQGELLFDNADPFQFGVQNQ